MVVSGIKKKNLGPKIRSLDRHKYQKKTFFEIISSISWGLCTGTKGEKVVLFGFSTGTKCEKLNFYSTNILNSPLVPSPNPKITTFSPLVPVQSPQENEEIISKKVLFLGS
jgi:hypothetical protein